MKQIKFTTESGTTYTLVDDHHFRIKKGDSGYEWAIKPWQWFAFDENDPSVKGGIGAILDDAKRLDPIPGLRLMVYGKDEWRISTRIKTIEEI